MLCAELFRARKTAIVALHVLQATQLLFLNNVAFGTNIKAETHFTNCLFDVFFLLEVQESNVPFILD